MPLQFERSIYVLGYHESSLTRHRSVPKGWPPEPASLPGSTVRGAAFFEWDVRAGKLLKIHKRANLELFFQALDLANHANFGSSYNSNVRASNFGTPFGFITPAGVTLPRSFCAQFRF